MRTGRVTPPSHARPGRRFLIAVSLLLAGMPLSAPPASARDKTPMLSFAEANRKWENARCRNRIPLKIKNGRDKEGWSRGPYMAAATPGDKGFLMIFKVSDRRGLARLMAGDIIPPGTRFVSRGWRARKDKGHEGIVLELEFADLPIEARLVAVGTDHRKFDQVERYARIEAFQLEAADERLAEVPAASSATAAASTGTAASAGDGSRPSADAAVRILSTSVQPPRATRGANIRLVATYEVTDLPPGASAHLEERREVWRDDELVLRDAKSFERTAGTHTTELAVRADVEPGLYELRVTISSGDANSSGTALFAIE